MYVANDWQNTVLHQSIEIGAGIRIEDVGQPNILVPLSTEDKKRNLKKVGVFLFYLYKKWIGLAISWWLSIDIESKW